MREKFSAFYYSAFWIPLFTLSVLQVKYIMHYGSYVVFSGILQLSL